MPPPRSKSLENITFDLGNEILPRVGRQEKRRGKIERTFRYGAAGDAGERAVVTRERPARIESCWIFKSSHGFNVWSVNVQMCKPPQAPSSLRQSGQNVSRRRLA